MTGKDIVILVLGIALAIAIAVILLLIFNKSMKEFVVEKMEEAEKMGKSGAEKFQYVVEAFVKKYKILQFILNVKKFIEYIIGITKNINYNVKKRK